MQRTLTRAHTRIHRTVLTLIILVWTATIQATSTSSNPVSAVPKYVLAANNSSTGYSTQSEGARWTSQSLSVRLSGVDDYNMSDNLTRVNKYNSPTISIIESGNRILMNSTRLINHSVITILLRPTKIDVLTEWARRTSHSQSMQPSGTNNYAVSDNFTSASKYGNPITSIIESGNKILMNSTKLIEHSIVTRPIQLLRFSIPIRQWSQLEFKDSRRPPILIGMLISILMLTITCRLNWSVSLCQQPTHQTPHYRILRQLRQPI